MNPHETKPQHASHEPGQGAGYEQRDVDVGAILRPALVLFVVTVFTFVAMRWLYVHFEARAVRQDRPPAAAAVRQRELPPEPRLQTSPPQDLARMRAEEEKTLESYAWINRESGVVRIPIDRAIEILAERGLPAREDGR